jgi:hypothetical protein
MPRRHRRGWGAIHPGGGEGAGLVPAASRRGLCRRRADRVRAGACCVPPAVGRDATLLRNRRRLRDGGRRGARQHRMERGILSEPRSGRLQRPDREPRRRRHVRRVHRTHRRGGSRTRERSRVGERPRGRLRLCHRQGARAARDLDVEGAGAVLGGARQGRAREPVPRAGRREGGAVDRGRGRARHRAALQGMRWRGPRVWRPDDLTPSALGFASSCPAVAVPDGASCGGPVATLVDLVTCVTCVAEHDSQCADRAAVPAFVAYPSTCAEPPGTCSAGIECTTAANCPAGFECLDNGSGTTRYCVGPACTQDGDCGGGAVCQQYCTYAGCGSRRCVCPGFACGASEVCIDDGGLACRQLCTQDSDCPPPLGVCVNSTFGSGLCISSSPCQ